MGPGVQGESGAQASALCGRAAHCGCQVGQGRSGSTRQAVGEASAMRRVHAGLRHASRAERGEGAGLSRQGRKVVGRTGTGEGWAGRLELLGWACGDGLGRCWVEFGFGFLFYFFFSSISNSNKV